MSALRLEQWNAADGPVSEKKMMKLLETEGFEVSVYAYPSGTRFPEHEHAREKCDAVLEGTLRVTVGVTAFDLTPGDRIYLPPCTRHSAEVVGKKTVLSLDGTKW
jgi:quercetin dioxygenase-like cupin family protein